MVFLKELLARILTILSADGPVGNILFIEHPYIGFPLFIFTALAICYGLFRLCFFPLRLIESQAQAKYSQGFFGRYQFSLVVLGIALFYGAYIFGSFDITAGLLPQIDLALKQDKSGIMFIGVGILLNTLILSYNIFKTNFIFGLFGSLVQFSYAVVPAYIMVLIAGFISNAFDWAGNNVIYAIVIVYCVLASLAHIFESPEARKERLNREYREKENAGIEARQRDYYQNYNKTERQ